MNRAERDEVRRIRGGTPLRTRVVDYAREAGLDVVLVPGDDDDLIVAMRTSTSDARRYGP